jgi:hypothetical protein
MKFTTMNSRSFHRYIVAIAAAAMVGAAAPGCSSTGADGAEGNGETSPAFFPGETGADGGNSSAACVAKTVKADQIPLDMLLLLDASSSMVDPTVNPQKWASTVSALTAFFDDPASRGISVGLHIFPSNHPGCTDPAIYQSPQIDYGLLPANRAALVQAMADTNPALYGSTPLHAVAEGALAGAIEWKKTHAGHTVVAVLATDGTSSCITSVAPETSAAKALAQGVRTFAIGMQGADFGKLNVIASAGGTTRAYDATNITLFSKQMNDIRGIAMPCEVVIPPPPDGQTFDRTRVNVEYTPTGVDTANTIPYVASASGCGTDGGWYYDNEVTPTKVTYCQATCTSVRSDTNGTVNVAFGCTTVGPK